MRKVLNLLAYHRTHTIEFAKHDFHNAFLKCVSDLRGCGFIPRDGDELLDLGCGQRFPNSLLFASRGLRVAALDVNMIAPGPAIPYFFRVAKQNGLKRAAMSITRRMLFDRLYYRTLEREADTDLSNYERSITFISANAEAADYPLAGDRFDFIVSNAVLEHVADLDKYFRETARLLKQGGVFYGLLHNFYSISGGHNLEWAFPDTHPSSTVPPWDHLRQNLFPAHVYLNKKRPEEYLASAEKHLRIVLFEPRDIHHNHGGTEGDRYLTESVARELRAFDKELLLTRAYCIIAKK